MAFWALEFSDGPVYTREKGGREEIYPQPLGMVYCSFTFIYLLYLSVCMGGGRRGGSDLIDYECGHTGVVHVCGSEHNL